MLDLNRRLALEQLDKKLQKLAVIADSDLPPNGWIYSIRTTLNMSLAQLGKRLKKTAQSVKEIEERERDKSLTLKRLIEFAEALNLRFVYGFVPKDSSIENLIEKRATEVAREIVMRTSHTMSLEDQQNSDARLQKAIKDRAEKIKQEMPKFLWD
ncbi:MAG: mobile mystery protein A [Ignavibacteria bacterium]|nr:mobile mystery protein A [Ignavibacteria bacterium]